MKKKSPCERGTLRGRQLVREITVGRDIFHEKYRASEIVYQNNILGKYHLKPQIIQYSIVLTTGALKALLYINIHSDVTMLS